MLIAGIYSSGHPWPQHEMWNEMNFRVPSNPNHSVGSLILFDAATEIEKAEERNIPREEVSSREEAKQSQVFQFGEEMADMINVCYK